MRDPRNDWRAIYHNLFIALWERLAEYSSATLAEFRDRFRPLAHEQDLYPKTQFLYRMLKAHIADLAKQEEVRLREQLIAAVKTMTFNQPQGWPELAVIPLDGDGSPVPTPTDTPAATVALTSLVVHSPTLVRALPSRCPYPTGARGAVVLVRGRWFSLDWFEEAACAQVYWYQMILAGVEDALDKETDDARDAAQHPEDIKSAILGTLGNSTCTSTGTQEEEGGTCIEIRAGEYQGKATCRGTTLVRLHIGEAEAEVLYDKPKPTYQPRRLLTVNCAGPGTAR